MITSIKNKSPFVFAIAMLAVIGLIMLAPTEVIFRKVFNSDFKSEYVDLTFKMGLLFLIGYSFIRILKFTRLQVCQDSSLGDLNI